VTFNRGLRIFGNTLVLLGVLLLLFVAFQLWGTGILQARSQSALRSQINHELPKTAARAAAASTPTSVPSGPPVTVPVVAPPAIGQPVGVIQIPSIGLNQVIVEGVADAELSKGPGHYPGTPLPGELGNVAIAGHRTTYGHPFYSLNAVAKGDRIILTTPQGVFTYRALSQQSVAPTDVAVLDDSSGAMLTLTTCTPRYSAAQRLVLLAHLTSSKPFTGASASTSKVAPSSAPKNALAGETPGAVWVPAVLWGLLAAAVGLGTVLAARITRRRWWFYSGGTVVLLVVLFFFFASIDPLLPASF
jgi:sortase A